LRRSGLPLAGRFFRPLGERPLRYKGMPNNSNGILAP
jgi:hypothetical protein